MIMDKNLINFLKKDSKALIVPIFMIIFGILFIVKRAGVLSFAVQLIGVFFIVAAVVLGFSLIAAFVPSAVVFAVILLAVGIMFLTNPGDLIKFVIMIVGLTIMINAILRIFEAKALRGKDKDFMKYIANDILTAVLGFVLFFLSGTVADAVFIIIGIIMTVLGLSNIYTAYKVYKGGRFVDDGSDVVWEE